MNFTRAISIPNLLEARKGNNDAAAFEILKVFALVKEANVAGITQEQLNNKYPENMQHELREHISFNVTKLDLFRTQSAFDRAVEYCDLEFMFLFLENARLSDKAGMLCDIMAERHSELVEDLIQRLDDDRID